MRISDWSSDVCSSDLLRVERRPFGRNGVDLVIQRCHLCGQILGHSIMRRIALGKLVTFLRRLDKPRLVLIGQGDGLRSEERRVGKECVSPFRSRWSQTPYKKNKKKP